VIIWCVIASPRGGATRSTDIMKSKYQLPDAKQRLRMIESIAQVASGPGTYDIKGPYKGHLHSVHVRFKSSESFSAQELAGFFQNACVRYGIDCIREEHIVKINPETVDVNAAA